MKRLLLALALLSPTLLFAESSIDGTWKTDLQSTEYQGKETFSLQNGVYRCDSCVPKLTVKADGRDHKITGSPYFDTVSVHQVNDDTVEVVTKKSGKQSGTSKMIASEDGKTLATEFTFQTEGGQSGNGSYKSKRLQAAPQGAHKVSGVWQPQNLETASESMRTVTYKSTDGGLSMADEAGGSYTAKFDGKDYPYKGDPGVTTVSLKKIDANSVEETYKLNGKVVYVQRMAVAADGKSMNSKFEDKRRDVTILSKLDKQ